MSSYKYGRYINTDQETRWATEQEIKNCSTRIELSSDTYPVAGIPLLTDEREVWVDGEDTHTLIFGATGSKKTRLFCMPTLNFFIKAGESFVCTDPKGELYAKTSGLARAQEYETIVLNFRDIGCGDMWNPLRLPYDHYHAGDIEIALSMLNDFIATLAEPHMQKANDIFWPQMASSYALANLLLLMECASIEEVNVTSLATLCGESAILPLLNISSRLPSESIAKINYDPVLDAPEKTRQSILSSLYAMIRIFTTQKKLCGMLSDSSFDMSLVGRRKTAIYLIIPDEKTTYHFLASLFIKQIYEVMIAEAQKEANGQLPVRVNFMLDEFCNIPRIPDMASMISAARSRNMRYFLVAQSKHQLIGRYGEDAETIKGNCDNWVFLTSKELDLLKEISELCGYVNLSDNNKRSLISVSELQRLDKSKGEALIMHCRQYPIITEITDIDDYECFKGCPAVPLSMFKVPDVKIFSVNDLLSDIRKGKRPVPFSQ